MNKVLQSIIYVAILCTSFLYADNNKTISDEEFMKQWEQLEKERKEVRDKTEKSKKELEDSKKLGRTLDELLNRIEEIKKHGK